MTDAERARVIEVLEPFLDWGPFAKSDIERARALRDDLIAARSQPAPATDAKEVMRNRRQSELQGLAQPNKPPPQPAPSAPARAIEIRWQQVNDEPFEYAIQQGLHGDEFVKLLDGSCLRRPVRSAPPVTEDMIERALKAFDEREWPSDKLQQRMRAALTAAFDDG